MNLEEKTKLDIESLELETQSVLDVFNLGVESS